VDVVAALVGAVVTAGMSYLIYRLGRQDKTLETIEVNVNSRLSRIDAALSEAMDLVHESRESGQPVPLPERNGDSDAP
jgi:hypothetical protein